MSADDILKLLDELASRIQGPAENVWHLVVARVFVENLVWSVVLAAIGVIALLALRWSVRDWRRHPEYHTQNDLPVAVPVFVAACLVLVGVVVSLPGHIINLATPEYAALQQIIEQLRGTT